MKKHVKALAIITTASLLSATAYADFSSTLPDFVNPPQQYLQNHPLLVPAASSLFAPIGFGADFGNVSLTALGVNEWPGGNKVDGAAAVGVGLGNGDKYLGATVTGVIDSLGYRDRFAKNGDVGVKLFRWLGSQTSVAAGANNAVGWGALANYSKSYYGAVTQQFTLGQILDNNNININGYDAPFSVTVGGGTGSFVSPTEFTVNESDGKVSPFAAISFSPIPRVNLIGDYTSSVYSAGISGMPFATFPFILTAYATNLGGSNKVPGPVTYGAMATIAYNFMQ